MPRWLSDEAAVVAALRPAKRILFGQCCGFPRDMLAIMLRHADELQGKELVFGLYFGDALPESGRLGEAFRVTTYQPSPGLARLSGGHVHKVVPMRYRDMAAHFAPDGPYPVDAVVFQAVPGRSPGTLSLGVSCDYVPSLLGKVPITLAQVNHKMPYTFGDAEVAADQVEYLFRDDQDLDLYDRTERDPEMGKQVASLLRDGDVLQIGLGKMPLGVLDCLDSFRNISVYGVCLDPMLPLLERGVVQGTGEVVKGRRRLVTGQLMGSEALWRYAHENPLIEMRPCNYTHNELKVGQLRQFVAINSALEVDLAGQVNAEINKGKVIAGVGGQLDFVISAKLSPGGRSIICLPALGSRGVSRIVPAVEHVTSPKYLVDYVVTEYGIADLRGKSYAERAEALIAVAAPGHRQWLLDHAGGKG